MNSPVDIKAVLDAMGADEEARSKPVRVHVYVDEAAPSDLANIVFAATKTSAENATVLYDAYLPQHALPDAAADLAVLVAADGGETGDMYANLHAVGVPTAVFAMDAHDLRAAANAAGKPIANDDIIAPDRMGSLPSAGDAEGSLVDAAEARAMFGRFGEWIVDVFKDKRLAFAYAFPCVRRPLALEAVNNTAVQNAGIGVVFIIPGADLPLMTLNQVKMLLEMAAAYGEELSLGRLKEILAIVGGAFACRAVARQLVGALPGIGWAVKGGIGYAGTVAMGRALLGYFESGTDLSVAAESAVRKVQAAAEQAGAEPQRGLAGNVAAIAGAAGDTVARAAAKAGRDFVPTIGAVAQAAGKATGFSQEDLAGIADKAVGAVRSRIGR